MIPAESSLRAPTHALHKMLPLSITTQSAQAQQDYRDVYLAVKEWKLAQLMFGYIILKNT